MTEPAPRPLSRPGRAAEPSLNARDTSGQAHAGFTPPRTRGVLTTWTQIVIVAGIIGLLASVSQLTTQISFIQVYGRLTGWATVFMWATTVLELFALRNARLLPRRGEERSRLHQRLTDGDRDAFGHHDKRFKHARLGLPLLPALLILALKLPTTKATTLVLTLAFVAVWIWRKQIESDLVDLQADLHAQEAVARAEAREDGRTERTPVRREPVLSHCIDPHVAAARKRAIRRARRALISVTAMASITTVLAFCAVAISAITDFEGFHTGRWHQPHYRRLKKPRAGGATAVPNTSGQGSSIHGNSGGGGHARGGTSAPCPAITNDIDAPTVKVRELEALYAGPGSLGRNAAGCPDEIKERPTPDGRLYWTRGEEAGTARSIAIVPPGYKNTIAIGPAVEPTEELIEEHADVHGPETFPRYYAGPGEYYVLYLGAEETPAVLLGEQISSETTPQPLRLLRPAAVIAWISTVRERKLWLWPTASRESDQAEIFGLKASGSRRILETITYERSSQAASRKRVEIPYLPDSESLTLAEIRHWAPPITP
jgi:hypothetical protein